MTKQIPLTRGKYATVDDEDYEAINKHRWHCNGDGYARRNIGPTKHQRNVYMARVIMNAPRDKEVDHIDCDPLNNCRSNLRLCSRAGNIYNRRKFDWPTSSKYKGVGWKEANNKWQAHIGINGRRVYLGLFPTEESAALAYNKAAQLYHGEFARLNDIPERREAV